MTNIDVLGEGFGRIEARMRAEVAKAFTDLVFTSLSPGNTQQWNCDGFYTAKSASELAQHGFVPPPLERDFAVSPDCPYWSAAFAQGPHVFRGFLRHAWMPMPEVAGSDLLAFAVADVGVGGPEVIEVSVGGTVLEPVLEPMAHPCDPNLSLLLWRLGDADPLGELHLRSSAPVVQDPKLGRVSAVVGRPFWFG